MINYKRWYIYIENVVSLKSVLLLKTKTWLKIFVDGWFHWLNGWFYSNASKMSHNFTTLFCTKTLLMWTFFISILSITLTKSPSVLDAFQIILEVMMGQFLFSIIFSWKPKLSVFALFAFLLVADCKSFARGNQQISETIKKKLCGV